MSDTPNQSTPLSESNARDYKDRLLEDEGFRRTISSLSRMARLAVSAPRWRDELIRNLSSEGVPKAYLARLAGLSPQRINSITHGDDDE